MRLFRLCDSLCLRLLHCLCLLYCLRLFRLCACLRLLNCLCLLYGLCLGRCFFGEEAVGVSDSEAFEKFFGDLVPVLFGDDALGGEEWVELFDDGRKTFYLCFFGAEALSDADDEVVVEVEVALFDADVFAEQSDDGALIEEFLVKPDKEAEERDEEVFGDLAGEQADAFVGCAHDGGDACGCFVEAGGIEALVVAGGTRLGFDLALGVLDEFHRGV